MANSQKMARAYSDDLRRKVLSAYAAGKGTMRELAARFDVSYGWVLKISAAQRQSGSYKRVPQRRAPSRIDAGLIRRLVEAQPDIVLVELQQKVAEHGVRVSTVHLWRILAKLGVRDRVHAVLLAREAGLAPPELGDVSR